MRATDKSPKRATEWLQEHLTAMQDYFNRWKIKVNVAKSEMILFTRRRRLDDDAPNQLTLGNETIKQIQQVKYLGIVFQSNLKFTKHCSNGLNKAKALKKKLWKFISPFSSLSVKNKIHVYRTYIRPVLTYNIHVWKDVAPTTFKKVQALQNIILRGCLRLRPHSTTFRQVNNETVHIMARIPSLKEFGGKIYEKFMFYNRSHVNRLVRNIATDSS